MSTLNSVMSGNLAGHVVKAVACLNCKSGRLNKYSPSQKRAQQILVTSLCTFSIALAIISVYFLLRIKQTFRHKLIGLLLVSQFLKAFWLWIYSILKLATRNKGLIGPVAQSPTSARFCHADGFFVAYGTDAADFAVLLIALHTVLTIFKPHRHLDLGGLHPYRYWAYVSWVAYPSLMASLAFIAGDHAYLEQGTFCALPIRPFWYRLALSWIPRYIILSFILAVYFTVYIYVGFKFKNLDTHLSVNSASVDSTYVGSAVRTDGSIDSDRASSHPTLRQRHKAIKRQLRFMFVYPVVYLLFWIVPFVSHCYGYTQAYTPYGVSTAALVSISLQCAADCTVFFIREKPWRRIDARWIPSRQTTGISTKTGQNVTQGGKSTEQDQTPRLQARRSRNWWDVENLLGLSDNDEEERAQSSGSDGVASSADDHQAGEK